MAISKLGKSAYSHVAMWYDDKDESIHVSMPDVKGFHTTVASWQHPELYEKLSDCLQLIGEQPNRNLDAAEDQSHSA